MNGTELVSPIEVVKALAFAAKPATFVKISPFRCSIMRAVSAALLLSTFLAQPVFAQGVKDPANVTSPSILTTSTKKTQTSQAASRPTATRNLAPGTLRAGTAAQGVWRDGKLVAVPR